MKGTLFLLVGNSGSGKDSILSYAVNNWKKNGKKLVIPKRYITRPPSPETEDYFSLSREEFMEMDGKGEFVLKWESYGILYGISKGILDALDDGDLVIANVSRQIIEDTRKTFPNVKVIFIWVPIETIIKRIRERGREKGKELESRVERARQNENLPGADYVIENTGTIEEAGERLISILEKYC
ncbi:MAG: hypothetical protein ACTSVI_10755 [Promethearchaeota archaeon]